MYLDFRTSLNDEKYFFQNKMISSYPSKLISSIYFVKDHLFKRGLNMNIMKNFILRKTIFSAFNERSRM